MAVAPGIPQQSLPPRQRAARNRSADLRRQRLELRRARDEAADAKERLAATAEILKVMANSQANVQPVLDSVATSAARLCDSEHVSVFLMDGDLLKVQANFARDGAGALPAGYEVPLRRTMATGRALLEGRTVHIGDIVPLLDSEYPDAKANQQRFGFRAVLAVPMAREGKAVGVIFAWRREARAFLPAQVTLLETFADQAVIAIDNVRLFNETREALERQTATAEVLRVISDSPGDVQPVLAAVCQRAGSICDARVVDIILVEGAFMRVAATYGVLGRPLGEAVPLDRSTVMGRSIVDRVPVQVDDLMAAGEEYPRGQAFAKRFGHRTILGVPLLREGRALGTILLRRPEVRPFSAQQIALIRTFADQAAIAIENARLFNETRDALERQTATGEILASMSGSVTDIQPVFDAIVRNLLRLFGTSYALVTLVRDGRIELAGINADAGLPRLAARFPLPLNDDTHLGRAMLTGKPSQLVPIVGNPEAPPATERFAVELGYNSQVCSPMVRDGRVIGAIVTGYREPVAFDGKQMELIRTFADQAVIAMENSRLFKELRERTEALSRSVGQLTALGEVSQAISASLDLDTVLEAIVQRAVQLAALDGGSIYEFDEGRQQFKLMAAEKMEPQLVEAVRRDSIRRGEGGAVGQCGVTMEPVEVPDILQESYRSARKELLIQAGYRSILAVPLVREGHLMGALLVNRRKAGAFAPEVIELLKTFASQSALAIQNARLFRELAEKGRQLEEASRHKSNFLASMSHELRTPLNAILGFNEMILDEVYGEVPADVKAPLQNIQASGKHLLRLINNVLDLAKIEAGRMELALADYSVQDTVASVHATLQPLAAEKRLALAARVAQDLPLAYGDGGRIAQCLMNLAGNALKFTRSGSVEITAERRGEALRYCVSDTGIGIPAEKIPSLFTEFKQTDATIASEYGGTGLGLSICRKFVEMHGGRIWVETEPGRGSRFFFEVPIRHA